MAAACHKLPMRSCFDNAALVENNDEIRVLDGAQPVSDNDSRANQGIQVAIDQRFGEDVQMAADRFVRP